MYTTPTSVLLLCIVCCAGGTKVGLTAMSVRKLMNCGLASVPIHREPVTLKVVWFYKRKAAPLNPTMYYT